MITVSLTELCKEIIYENQYTLEAYFSTRNVDELYDLIFNTENEFKDSILKIVKKRIK